MLSTAVITVIATDRVGDVVTIIVGICYCPPTVQDLGLHSSSSDEQVACYISNTSQEMQYHYGSWALQGYSGRGIGTTVTVIGAALRDSVGRALQGYWLNVEDQTRATCHL